MCLIWLRYMSTREADGEEHEGDSGEKRTLESVRWLRDMRSGLLPEPQSLKVGCPPSFL